MFAIFFCRLCSVVLGAVALLVLVGGCGGVGRPAVSRQLIDCMRVEGWVPLSRPSARRTGLVAVDGHAEVELVFWRSEAAARRAVPVLAPIGVGWTGVVSWRASSGFTLADEEALDRCLALTSADAGGEDMSNGR